jgi:hypothetical protein
MLARAPDGADSRRAAREAAKLRSDARQPVLAALGVALEQAELDKR